MLALTTTTSHYVDGASGERIPPTINHLQRIFPSIWMHKLYTSYLMTQERDVVHRLLEAVISELQETSILLSVKRGNDVLWKYQRTEA